MTDSKNATKPLWTPTERRSRDTVMQAFATFVAERTGRSFVTYQDLHDWSIRELDLFWGLLSEFVGIVWMTLPEASYVPGMTLRDGTWFKDSTLNFAANLLPRPSDEIVLVCYQEGLAKRSFTATDLWNAVARVATHLKSLGVGRDDRVAGVLSNGPEAVIAMLGAASLGAIWSSCSPDFGQTGVFDRLSQIEPKVVFLTKCYHYNGKQVDAGAQILPALERLKPAPHLIVSNPFEPIEDEFSQLFYPPSRQTQSGVLSIDFVPRAFHDPQYIMFSSGTTGLPKCIVHGVGGTLLQHKKELMLHSDVKSGDRMMFFTTCGWMMWNWMVSALGCGATVVTFDGSPTYPTHDRLWELARDEKLTHFGTSPKFVGACMTADGAGPTKQGQLPDLRCILSTGSPLLPAHFEWIYQHLPDVHLASISGGTDIISCFMLGNPTLPVYASEIQCAGLGMAIEAWNEQGLPVRQKKGELVCTKPFVSMPIGFWNDPDGEKYRKAYFSYYGHRDVWRHGDFIEITDHGGIVVYGRSDATLNPGGVRIGTAELYRAVETIPYIADSIAVGQNWQGDVRILLFVKLRMGEVWSDDRAKAVKAKIREELTPRHVPALVMMVPDIPYTRSGKKVEMAATQTIHGEVVPNTAALMNPESLAYFAALKSQYS